MVAAAHEGVCRLSRRSGVPVGAGCAATLGGDSADSHGGAPPGVFGGVADGCRIGQHGTGTALDVEPVRLAHQMIYEALDSSANN